MNQESMLELKGINEQANAFYESFHNKIPQTSLIMLGVGIAPLPANVAVVVLNNVDKILKWHQKKDSYLDNTNIAIIYEARNATLRNMEAVSDIIHERVQVIDDNDKDGDSRDMWEQYFIQISEYDVLVTSCRKNELDKFEDKIKNTIQQIEIGLVHE